MRVLITGGAGFIGCNTVRWFRELGHNVTVLDNLSRPGSKENLEWLSDQISDLDFVCMDIVDAQKVKDVVNEGRFDVIIHLAAQVAVTTSVVDPRHDFEVNALGTFNLLEAVRLYSPNTILLYASTNKVYGELTDLRIRATGKRYELEDYVDGISEDHPIDFHSPYGCSKGAADAYVIDYARIYGLRTACLRQSCIYGYRQFGVEDQGWVAWFIIAHLLNKPITIYGDGCQVRDVLFIDDLMDCYLRTVFAIEKDGNLSGRAFNIGGGSQNALSLLEFMELLGDISGRRVDYSFADWRPGDQRVFISNLEVAKSALEWEPRVNVHEGVKRLCDWVAANLDLFKRFSLHLR